MLVRRLAVAGTAGMLVLLAACGGASSSTAGPPTGGTTLTQALSRVADTANTRAQISFDDTAALVRLAGRNPVARPTGFGSLRGFGATVLQQYATIGSGRPGVNLFDAGYTVTAGNLPTQVALVAGGQQPGAVAKGLTKLGWKQQGDTLTAPAPGTAGGAGDDGLTSVLALQLAHVRTTGSDVAYGPQNADLSQIGSPSGTTLAEDPLISAISGCLGDVVAAEIMAPFPGGQRPAALGLGLRQPKADNDTPHAVVCAAWGTQAQADQYAKDVKQALTNGLSLATNTRYSAGLRHPSVRETGGAEHVVSWEADVVDGGPLRLFENEDLPALPDCRQLSALPPAARQRVDPDGLCK